MSSLWHKIYVGVESWVNTNPSKVKHDALGYRADRDSLTTFIYESLTAQEDQPKPEATIEVSLTGWWSNCQTILKKLCKEVRFTKDGEPARSHAFDIAVNALRKVFLEELKAMPANRSLPDDIRAEGWAVAVHNDYRLNGESMTFWLFTKNGRAIKGEGHTDAEALNEVRKQISKRKISGIDNVGTAGRN